MKTITFKCIDCKTLIGWMPGDRIDCPSCGADRNRWSGPLENPNRHEHVCGKCGWSWKQDPADSQKCAKCGNTEKIWTDEQTENTRPALSAAKTPADLEHVLQERGKRYGLFPDQAKLAQALRHKMHQHKNWSTMTDAQKEALDMIAHKISRAINGDPSYRDTWIDIAGYATLVAQTLPTDG